MSLIFATQLTAAATAALAVFAILTTVFAILAFRKQSKEVSDQASMLQVQSEQLAEQRKVNAEQIRVLGLQAAELRESLAERRREAAERRRAQAILIFISAEPSPEGSDPIDSFLVRIENTSQQPIYDLIFFWRDGTGEWNEPPGPPGHPVLMPGKPHAFVVGLVPSLPRKSFLRDTSLLGAGAVFRDAAGVRWRLRSDGQLDEIPVTE
jgi:hypothetical protein